MTKLKKNNTYISPEQIELILNTCADNATSNVDYIYCVSKKVNEFFREGTLVPSAYEIPIDPTCKD